jgi:multicomponent Na+:H+ antiporter subunit A
LSPASSGSQVAVTRIVQPGRLDFYMTATFVLIAIALFVPMAWYGEWPSMPVWPADCPVLRAGRCSPSRSWALVAVIWAKDRLTAIVSLGIQGFAVALFFMLLGAPDLSFTQFMVETLSVVILALAMTRLRLSPQDHRSVPRRPFSTDRSRWRRAQALTLLSACACWTRPISTWR